MSRADKPEDDRSSVPTPRENVDLIGHEAAEGLVLGAMNSGRLAHAWLITGPEGIGKATLAYRFARALLSSQSEHQSLDMAETDAVFKRVRAGTHGDLKVLERGRQERNPARRREVITVEETRDVGAFLSMSSSEGGRRVVIIDEADMMNTNAANALLKVLEEPPPGAVLILVASNPARLPITVRSRCRLLTLRPLSPPNLDSLISRFLPRLAHADRQTLISLSDGSIGRAITLSEYLPVWEEARSLLESLPTIDVPRLHGLGDLVERDDGAFHVLSSLLPDWLVRLTRLKGEGRVSFGSSPRFDAAVLAVPLDRWIEVWENVNALFSRARSVHLERRQTVLSSFHVIQKAMQGRS